jgi:hypothetical protein
MVERREERFRMHPLMMAVIAAVPVQFTDALADVKYILYIGALLALASAFFGHHNREGVAWRVGGAVVAVALGLGWSIVLGWFGVTVPAGM